VDQYNLQFTDTFNCSSSYFVSVLFVARNSLLLLCSVKELSVSCHTMQKRIMELIEQVQNEDVTGSTLK